MTLLAPESPKYLFSYKKYKESRQALAVIAKYNRAKNQGGKYLFDTEWDEIKKSRTVIPIIASPWSSRSNMEDVQDKNQPARPTEGNIINNSADRTAFPSIYSQ